MPVAEVQAELESRFAAIDEAALQQPPKRDNKVEMGPAEKTKLHQADPKLLENKFAATMVLLPEGVNPTNLESIEKHGRRRSSDFDKFREEYPEEVRRLLQTQRTIWSAPLVGTGGLFREESKSITIRDHLRWLIERCPPDQLPDEQLIDFLTSDEVNRDVLQVGTSQASRLFAWQYRVYAPNAEQAELRAAAILRLLDCGMCRPMQQYHLAKGREALAAAKEQQAVVDQLSKEIEAEEAKLDEPSEISSDILSELKAQKIMVAVELAGLSARVKACDEMLKGTRELPVSTIQSVSDMKIKAEIERVGIKEKLDQINKFIEEGDSRVATQGRILQITNEQRRAAGQFGSYQRSAATHAELIELYAPLQLQDNQLKIAPIEWTN